MAVEGQHIVPDAFEAAPDAWICHRYDTLIARRVDVEIVCHGDDCAAFALQLAVDKDEVALMEPETVVVLVEVAVDRGEAHLYDAGANDLAAAEFDRAAFDGIFSDFHMADPPVFFMTIIYRRICPIERTVNGERVYDFLPTKNLGRVLK